VRRLQEWFKSKQFLSYLNTEKVRKEFLGKFNKQNSIENVKKANEICMHNFDISMVYEE
jgi:hypothetical protein